MPTLSAQAREEVIGNFRIELAEHLQILNNGLLAIEQETVQGAERVEALRAVFRAAHSLKGAARVVGVTIVEQMAHALENVLDALQKNKIQPSQEIFSACYKTLDAIQLVQNAYEKGAITPPIEAMQALMELQQLWIRETKSEKEGETPIPNPSPAGRRESSPPLPTGEGLGVRAKDRIKNVFQNVLAEKQNTEKPIESAPPAAQLEERLPFAADTDTVRVKVSRLDLLMDRLNELLIVKIRSQQRLEQVKDISETVGALEKEWQETYDAASVSPTRETKILSSLGVAQDRIRATGNAIHAVTRELAGDISSMALALDEIEAEVKNLRALPLDVVTAPFARMVRDLAVERGKEIVFQVRGADLELDKRVIEQIKSPLIHLIRNAIDHGVETPTRRIVLGKSREGRIVISAEMADRNVVIRVMDDGSGLNMDELKRAVINLGVDPATLSESALQDYIFQAGVSTSATVTDISGRGVGLDVVRKNMMELGGACEVSSIQGKGAIFSLVIPLHSTGSRGLMVRTSAQTFAIPINHVEYIFSVQQDDIALLEGQEVVYQNNQSVALLWLCDALNIPRTATLTGATALPVVILKSGENRIAFIVDELLGEQEMVVKSLGAQLSRVAGLAGGTILGTGAVVLILNAKDLISMAMRGGYSAVVNAPEANGVRQSRHVLIVDDSITTRTLEKNILEAAGYSVEIATDGQEALNYLSTGNVPDIIISDVQMPRIDGIELTRRLKTNPQTAQIPVILVSSMDSIQDKQLGMDVGADAYIGKGGFNQNNLLEMIEMMAARG